VREWRVWVTRWEGEADQHTTSKDSPFEMEEEGA
jgi:hypothetical protein